MKIIYALSGPGLSLSVNLMESDLFISHHRWLGFHNSPHLMKSIDGASSAFVDWHGELAAAKLVPQWEFLPIPSISEVAFRGQHAKRALVLLK